MSATIKATNIYSYQDQVIGQRALIAVAADSSGIQSLSNNVLYWDINGTPQNIFTPTVGATGIRMADSRDYAFFCDGVASDLKKWHIVNQLAKWGITAPITGPTLGAPTSGSITLKTGRIYAVAFFNNTTQSYSDLSPFSAITGALTSQNQPLSGLPVSSDPQVSNKILVATADGGDETTLYEITTLANATTTYTDSMTEATLLTQSVWQDTDSNGVDHGLFGNQPPPNGSFPTNHNGRMFLAIGEVLFFSKSLSEVTTSTGTIAGRYEECWPPTNAINVSTQAEQIRGILSDGQVLYIGTEEHIFRLLGDSPQNFSEPQIIFPQTGLLNQNVWQLVYLEGTPVGTMWLTPDLRCMSSDFNTYQDVGTPIQTTLNSINQSALSAAWAVMVSNGPYNFYMLAIPTGSNTVPDTFCVYDMRLRQWYIWQFADQFLTGIYYINLKGIPRWIFVDSNGIVRSVNSTDVVDRATDANPQSIVSTVQTSWLDMGDNTLRKTLNELEIITDDNNMIVTIQGASTRAQLQSPITTLVSGSVLATSLFGASGDYKVYLAGTQAIDRFYKAKFSSTSKAVQGASDFALTIVEPGAVNSFQMTITAGPTGIQSGDTGVLWMAAKASNFSDSPMPATITDTSGNTWNCTSSPGSNSTAINDSGAETYLLSYCTASMAALAAGSKLTLTITMNNTHNSSVNFVAFMNLPGAGAAAFEQLTGDIGNNPITSIHSGSAQTSDGFYLSMFFNQGTITQFPPGFTTFPGLNSGTANFFNAAYFVNTNASSVQDNWIQTSANGAAVIMVRFNNFVPRSPASSTADVVLGGYSFEAVPMNRY